MFAYSFFCHYMMLIMYIHAFKCPSIFDFVVWFVNKGDACLKHNFKVSCVSIFIIHLIAFVSFVRHDYTIYYSRNQSKKQKERKKDAKLKNQTRKKATIKERRRERYKETGIQANKQRNKQKTNKPTNKRTNKTNNKHGKQTTRKHCSK